MRGEVIASSAAFFLALTFIVMPGYAPAKSTDQVCFNNHCLDVEVVTTDEARMRGLQSRPSLAIDQGMLFVFSAPGRHSFWMKDTLIPLDIIWLDYAKRVVYIEANAKPCKI